MNDTQFLKSLQALLVCYGKLNNSNVSRDKRLENANQAFDALMITLQDSLLRDSINQEIRAVLEASEAQRFEWISWLKEHRQQFLSVEIEDIRPYRMTRSEIENAFKVFERQEGGKLTSIANVDDLEEVLKQMHHAIVDRFVKAARLGKRKKLTNKESEMLALRGTFAAAAIVGNLAGGGAFYLSYFFAASEIIEMRKSL